MRGLIRDAFNAWETVCGVDFVEVSDSSNSDIRIGWASNAHSDGDGGALAFYSWFWTGTSTTKESAVIAVDHADSGVSLDEIYDTVLHEIGHAVGLAHSDVANVVMSGNSPTGPTPYWGGVPGRDPLQPDDIRGAVSLWGQPHGTGSPAPPPPPTTGATSGDDTLFGTQGADYINGGGGNDRIWGLRGNDTLLGGAGSDTLSGGLNLARDGAHESTGGRNVLNGGTGNDFMTAGYAGVGSVTWSPAPGSDTFTFAPGHGHDVVNGNWGDSVGQELFGAPEKIDLSAFGAQAPTWAEVSQNLSTVSATSAAGTTAPSVRLDLSDFGGGSITFWGESISNIDASDFIGLSTGTGYIEGTAGADTLRGGEGADTLRGLDGPDVLLGGGGADSILGGDGDDSVWGEAGDDYLNGAEGDDLMYGMGGDDTLAGGTTLADGTLAASGNDTLLGGSGDDAISGGGDGDDRLWGGPGDDTIVGGDGVDVLGGGPGDDTLWGGGGAGDYVWGEAGRDTVDGGAGRDVLVGGGGADRLIGGVEGDTFFGHGAPGPDASADTFVVTGGRNWLMDFQPGTDRIALTGTTEAALRESAVQLEEHLLLTGAGGEQIYMAWTTLAQLEGVDLLV